MVGLGSGDAELVWKVSRGYITQDSGYVEFNLKNL